MFCNDCTVIHALILTASSPTYRMQEAGFCFLFTFSSICTNVRRKKEVEKKEDKDRGGRQEQKKKKKKKKRVEEEELY